MAKDKICGIYCIENILNEKKYIGQSVDIYKRWYDHKWELNNGSHRNPYLQRAWIKYGEENFKFEIVEKCLPEELNDKEKYWINKMESYLNGYNLTIGGDGNTRKEWTDEQIESIANPVFQVDLNGKIIKKWPSINKASKSLNINARQIWNCANKHFSVSTENDGEKYLHTTKTAGGYIWVYERDIDDFDLDYYICNKSKRIRQYDLNWNLIRIWDSVSSVSKVGYSASTIYHVCNGKYKQAYNYIWTYDDIDIYSYFDWYNTYFNTQYIGQYDTNLNLIKTWNTPKETEADGFSANSVSSVLNGNSKTHKGYIFKYISYDKIKNTDISRYDEKEN